MARSFNGSSDYGRYAGSFASALPVTMSCWFQSSSATALQALMGFYAAANTTERLWLAADGAAAGDPVNAVATALGATTSARTSTGYSTNTWHHACGVYASATSRTAYIDGGSAVESTTSRSPSGLDRISAGVVDSSTQGQWLAGQLAELGWWDVALTAAEVYSLSRGISPRFIRPANLVRYEQFVGKSSPEPELIGGAVMTLTGTAAVAHPRVIGHRPRLVYVAPAVGGTTPKGWYGKALYGPLRRVVA